LLQTALAKKDKCSLLNFWLCRFKLHCCSGRRLIGKSLYGRYLNKMNKLIITSFVLIFFHKLILSQTNGNQTVKILYDSTYQVSLNQSIPILIGKFKIFELDNEKTSSSLYEFKFLNLNDKSLFTQVVDTVYDFVYWPDHEFGDFNFDGYLDFWTVINRDVKAQPGYHFWIFNPANNTFEINQEFSDSLVCNLDFNSRDSTISTGCQGGCVGMCGSESTYKVNDNHLVLIETSETEQVEINGEWKFRSSTHKLINGNWQKVKEDYFDYP
jgi:hypothetical protein